MRKLSNIKPKIGTEIYHNSSSAQQSDLFLCPKTLNPFPASIILTASSVKINNNFNDENCIQKKSFLSIIQVAT